MTTLYGISNCDTIRKAKKWLENKEVDFNFHDYRKQGLESVQLEAWADKLGWEALLNRRGTTWRKLDDAEKDNINRERAIALMLEQPAMIKRPLLEQDDQFLLGFSEASYQELFCQ